MNNIEKHFCSYEQSLELKKLGFDNECLGRIYADNHIEILDYRYKNSDAVGNVTSCSCILFSQAFSFLRDKYNIHTTITSISQESWQFHLTKPGEVLGTLYEEDFYFYEEAEQSALNKILELCKKN